MKIIEKLIKNNYKGIEFDYRKGRMSILFDNLSKEEIGDIFLGDVKENLLNEHKEKKIKLTWLERDLLSIFFGESSFSHWNTLMDLKNMGHFKGVTDVNMTFKEILNNCEVVE